MSRSLNIAHCVEFYAPSVGGMQEVVKQLSERMVRMGHRVTVFTSTISSRTTDEINGVTIRSFQVSGNAAEGITGDADAYWQALSSGGFDVITLFAAQQWTADVVLPRVRELKAATVFVPTGFSRAHDPKMADYYARMPEWMREVDLNVFLSHTYRDAMFATAHGIQRRTLIPNGAAQEEFDAPPTLDIRASFGLQRDTLLLLHVGGYTGAKGQLEALRIYLRAHTGNAVLLLVGNGIQGLERTFHRHWRFLPSRLRARILRKRIIFKELDRAATVAAMRQADLFLFPSLVECSPIVLFETMAAGVPFLASRAGNAEEIMDWTNAGWIIAGTRDEQGLEHPDIAAGAQLLTELIAHPQQLKERGANGRKAWREHYTWQHIAERYLLEYQRLVAEKHG